MRDHSPTARHPSTPQSRTTAARKRRQIQALTARVIAESIANFKFLGTVRQTVNLPPAPQALEPQRALEPRGGIYVLAALLSAHAPRRL